MENLNKRKLIPSLAAIAFCFGVSTTANAEVLLDDYGFNIDGNVAYPFDIGAVIPPGVDILLFDEITGLGTISIDISGDGDHYFAAFFDHEISETDNTYFNETGSSNGTPATDPGGNQSWEIDEPFDNGDIYVNFEDSALDNKIGVSIFGDTTFPDDVSMAMGWDFTLANGDTALIMLMLGIVEPTSGFFLAHTDPGIPGTGTGASAPTTIYLSGTLVISPIPVPAAVWLFGSALLGLVGFSRRKAKA